MVDWSKFSNRITLLIPGPTEIPPSVSDALRAPPTINYDNAFNDEKLDPLVIGLEEIFQTKRGKCFAMPGSGRTAMESAALSVLEPGDAAVVVIAGFFGLMMKQICVHAGAKVTEFEVEWGTPIDLGRLEEVVRAVEPTLVTMVHNETTTGSTYPVEPVARIAHEAGALLLVDTVSSLGGVDIPTDEWGIDLSVSAPQKCLAGPIGTGLVCASPRAWERIDARSTPAGTWINDLRRWKQEWLTTDRGGPIEPGSFRMQPVGISTHMTAALTEAVRLVREEGLENRFARHATAARAVGKGLEALGMTGFQDASLTSNTVCCFRVPDGVNATDIVRIVKGRYGLQIAGGLAKLGPLTIRIGVMGMTASPMYALAALSAVELALVELGVKVELGSAVHAAQTVFGEDVAPR